MIEIDTLMEMITRLEERVQKLEGAEEIDYGASLDTNEQCRKHQCSYYTRYLLWGGPDLTHEAYHFAETRYIEVQNQLLRWLEAHKDDNEEEPEELRARAEQWERKVRA
jgi:hypothetical protein